MPPINILNKIIVEIVFFFHVSYLKMYVMAFQYTYRLFGSKCFLCIFFYVFVAHSCGIVDGGCVTDASKNCTFMAICIHSLTKLNNWG